MKILNAYKWVRYQYWLGIYFFDKLILRGIQMGKNLLKHWYKDSVPCRSACPADTDIPGYLEAIYNNEFDKAYQINFNDNFFPEILGRVCSRPCEDNCRHGEYDNGSLYRYVFQKEQLENSHHQKK